MVSVLPFSTVDYEWALSDNYQKQLNWYFAASLLIIYM